MKINKALIKYELRTMKWMLLYFMIISVGYIVMFNFQMNNYYLSYLKYSTTADRQIVMIILRDMSAIIAIFFGIGIVLMTVLQFRDSKSTEVGRFLKALPISSREYYLTKIVSGILSYTIPFIILIIGILVIKANNMHWVNDVNNISIASDIFIKSDSMTNIATTLLLYYSIISATYTFLFMIQYLVMNTISGIVIGVLCWLSPIFIVASLTSIYDRFFNTMHWMIRSSLVILQPWLYIEPNFEQILPEINQELYFGHLYVYEEILTKIIICTLITLISIAISYFLAKGSRVENADTMITFKLAKKIFITGVTVCSALLGGMILIISLGNYTDINLIIVHMFMAITGVIGFIISRKIANVGIK